MYIYLGSGTDLVMLPEVQKIRPSEVINLLTPSPSVYPFPNASFGYSISGGIDLDGNGYPDLAIGAYEQEQIVVFQVEQNSTLKLFFLWPIWAHKIIDFQFLAAKKKLHCPEIKQRKALTIETEHRLTPSPRLTNLRCGNNNTSGIQDSRFKIQDSR